MMLYLHLKLIFTLVSSLIFVTEPHEDVAPNIKKDSKPRQGTESLHPLEYSSITSSHQSPKEKKRSSNEKSGK